jgi:hypothetical protein
MFILAVSDSCSCCYLVQPVLLLSLGSKGSSFTRSSCILMMGGSSFTHFSCILMVGGSSFTHSSCILMVGSWSCPQGIW